MKKIFALMLAMALVFTLAACGEAEKAEDTKKPAEEVATPDVDTTEEEAIEEEAIEEEAKDPTAALSAYLFNNGDALEEKIIETLGETNTSVTAHVDGGSLVITVASVAFNDITSEEADAIQASYDNGEGVLQPIFDEILTEVPEALSINCIIFDLSYHNIVAQVVIDN